MKTKEQVETMRDDLLKKAMEYQAKCNKAYFEDKKIEMNEFESLYRKYITKYHTVLEVLNENP